MWICPKCGNTMDFHWNTWQYYEFLKMGLKLSNITLSALPSSRLAEVMSYTSQC